MRSLLGASALVVLLTVACSALPGASPTPPSGGGSAPGPAISVADALASDSDQPVLVSGALFIVRGEARLCSAILESYPPQCGGDSLLVAQLDPSTVPGIQSDGGVTWADQAQLLGTVRDGVLTITPS